MKKPIKWTLSIYVPIVVIGIVVVTVIASIWPHLSMGPKDSSPFSNFFAADEKRFYEHVATLYASGENLELSEDYPVAWDSLSIHYRPLDITFSANAEMLDKISGLPIYDLEGGKSLLVFYHEDKVVDTVIYFSNEVIFFDDQGAQIQVLTLPRSDARFKVEQNILREGVVQYDCYLLKKVTDQGKV